MWQSIHDKLFYDRHSAQSSNDAATVSAILLTAQQFDTSPPADVKAALASLRVVLAGTKALHAVEQAFHQIIK